jgi:hypothetical protein
MAKLPKVKISCKYASLHILKMCKTQSGQTLPCTMCKRKLHAPLPYSFVISLNVSCMLPKFPSKAGDNPK